MNGRNLGGHMRILCMDVGGTYIKISIVSPDGVTKLPKKKTRKDCLASFLDEVQEIYTSCGSVDGIALSTPGVVDEVTDFMYTGGSLRFVRDLDVKAMIASRCDGLPVSIRNDAKAGAEAELQSGVLAGRQSGIILIIGTALGGAVVLDRKILSGPNHFAGEFSYLALDNEDGSLKYRHWGKHQGARRVAELYQEKTANCGKQYLPEQVFALAEAGDDIALQAISDYCDGLVIPLVNMQCIVDPEVIAIGGGISAQRLLLEILNRRIEIFQTNSGMCEYGMPRIKVEACRYQDNTMGAYYHFLDQYEKKPETHCGADREERNGKIC